MWFESQENRGSTFFFSMVTTAATIDVHPVPQSFFAKRVLIIDSSESLLRVLSVRLYSWSITPVTLKSTKEALSLFETSQGKRIVDLIIVDSRQDINGICIHL
jgi:hypothetical protein